MIDLIETVAAHPFASVAVGLFLLAALVLVALLIEGAIKSLCVVWMQNDGGK